MPDFTGVHPFNVPGKYYVGQDCLDCDACRATAPDIFRRDESGGGSYVARQPVTPEEIFLAEEALEGCCVETIGNDGDQYDWKTFAPIDPGPKPIHAASKTHAKRTCCDHAKAKSSGPPVYLPPPTPRRPWWKFW